MSKKRATRPFTLTEADISSRRAVTRRSMLSALGLGAAAAAIVGSGHAVSQARTGCTDGDAGRSADPPGAGIRCRPGMQPTGCTDNDSGPNSDPIDYGTSCQPRSTPPRDAKGNGCTDNDSGPNEDQPGFGTRCWI